MKVIRQSEPFAGADEQLEYRFECVLDAGNPGQDALAQLTEHAQTARRYGHNVPDPVPGHNTYYTYVYYEKHPSKQKRNQALKRLIREHSNAWQRFGVKVELVSQDWEFVGPSYVRILP